jgi:hypothetical protein
MLSEVGKEMIGEAFQSIINSKAPKRGVKEWVGKRTHKAISYKGEAKIAFPYSERKGRAPISPMRLQL